MMCSPESGSRWWISATRPAIELSIGIIASSARPDVTASSASSKVVHGNCSRPGNISVQAIAELAPGSPWYAIGPFWVTPRAYSAFRTFFGAPVTARPASSLALVA